jgi:hypothetical protein
MSLERALRNVQTDNIDVQVEAVKSMEAAADQGAAEIFAENPRHEMCESMEFHELEELRNKFKPTSDEYECAVITGTILRMQRIDERMTASMSDTGCSYQRNHEILTFAIKVASDAGAKLKKVQSSFGNALDVLSDFKAHQQEYMEDIRLMGAKFNDVVVDSALIDLWRDLSVWLMAYHDITANASKDFIKDDLGFVRPKSDGSYPTINAKDGFFKLRTGVSKYALVHNFGVAAKTLENKVKSFETESSQTPRPA